MLPQKENITDLAQLHQVTCIKKVTVVLKRNSQKVFKPKQKSQLWFQTNVNFHLDVCYGIP